MSRSASSGWACEGSAVLLDARTEERSHLLRRLRAALEADEQVVAAYLFGSLGRGEEDALSDLDLWVLLDDPAAPTVMRERRAYAARVALPLAVVEAPQNAPPGGAYLLALYPGETGPHQVDWYWQPASLGESRADLRLLFDRGGAVPAAGTAPPEVLVLPEALDAEEEALRNRMGLLGAMLLIQAKYLARKPHAEGLEFLGFLEELLRGIGCSEGDVCSPTQRDTSDPRVRLAILRGFVDLLGIRLAEGSSQKLGYSPEFVPQIRRFLDCVEVIVSGS